MKIKIGIIASLFFGISLYAQEEATLLKYRFSLDDKQIEYFSNGENVATYVIDSAFLRTSDYLVKEGKLYRDNKSIGTFKDKKLTLNDGAEYKFVALFFSNRKTKIIEKNSRDKVIEFTKTDKVDYADALELKKGSTSRAEIGAIKAWGLFKESDWLLKEHGTLNSVIEGVAISTAVFLGILIHESL